MQKELSEKLPFSNKDIELFSRHSDSIDDSDIVAAVRIALLAKDKDLSQIGKNLTVSKFSEQKVKPLKQIVNFPNKSYSHRSWEL